MLDRVLGGVRSVGVVGGGVVGHATALAYKEHVAEVKVHDLDPLRGGWSFEEAAGCQVVFVCVPEDAVDSVVRRLVALSAETNVVIRSTVPVGTTQRLGGLFHAGRLVHSPEFLTERTATFDAAAPAVLIVGSVSYPCRHAVRRLYEARFPHVRLILTSSRASEAIKLFTNAFYAAKISLFNELRAVADGLGVEWAAVLDGMLANGRIHPSHTQVPGPDGQPGFGGRCLPKDLAELVRQGRELSAPVNTFSAAYTANAMDFRPPPPRR